METSDHTHDLDWLLTSGQAGPELLAQALMAEYYSAVYRLALFMLDQPEAAQTAALHTFVLALKNVYRYRQAEGVRLWLFALALQAIRQQRRFVFGWSAWRKRLRRTEQKRTDEAQDAVQNSVWLAYAELKEPLRTALLLTAVFDWEVDETAQLLKQRPANLKPRLQAAAQRLSSAAAATETEPDTDPAEVARAALATRWPAPEVTASDLSALAQEAVHQAQHQEGSGQRWLHLREALLVALFAVLAGGLFWGANILAPEELPPTATPRVIIVKVTAEPETTPSTPPAAAASSEDEKTHRRLIAHYFPQPGDTLELIAGRLDVDIEDIARINHIPLDAELQPGVSIAVPVPKMDPAQRRVIPGGPGIGDMPTLDAEAESLEIYLFLSSSPVRWRNLWADGLFTDFGPPGYIGPAHTSRTQIWVSQPGLSKLISGDFGGAPAYASLDRNGLNYFYTLDSAFGPGVAPAKDLLQDTLFREIIFPHRAPWLKSRGTFEALGESELSGRRVIEVDWRNPEGVRQRRLWIDSETGVPLKAQVFAGPHGDLLRAELSLARVDFDLYLYGALFDPAQNWPERFGRDYINRPDFTPTAGEPESRDHPPTTSPEDEQRLALDADPLPPGFDPTGARLTFQYEIGADAPLFQGRYPVRVLADSYSLGVLELPSPWLVKCQRSPGGSNIAFQFLVRDDQEKSAYNGLAWTPLQPFAPRRVAIQSAGSPLAFDPSGRYLAFFASGSPESSGVFLLDTATGTAQRLLSLHFAYQFDWSADATILTVTGTDDYLGIWEKISLDPENGDVLERQPTSAPTASPNNDLFSSWAVELPYGPGGLEGCVEPGGMN